jgi:hypothetical protein
MTMGNKVETTKKIARFIVGTSVGYVANAMIKNNITPEKRRHKAEAAVGGLVVGIMASEMAEAWIDEKIDVVVKSWNDAKAKINS